MHKPTHSITPICDVNITQAEVYAICRRHRVLSCHYRCFWRMVARGEILSRDFGRRIVFRPNYEKATAEILEIVDRDFDYDTPMPCPTNTTP